MFVGERLGTRRIGPSNRSCVQPARCRTGRSSRSVSIADRCISPMRSDAWSGRHRAWVPADRLIRVRPRWCGRWAVHARAAMFHSP